MSGTSSPEKCFERLRVVASGAGMDVVASARIDDDLRKTYHPALVNVADGLESAVVIGMRLSRPVLDTVVRAPTWTYYHHYRMINTALDQAALRLAGECMSMGYRSFPIPASQILEWDRLRAHLSHRQVGALAGIGWRGRNNLLVHPEYGSQVRYATILTDMPLPKAELHGGSCGDCLACLSVCPVGAIKRDPEKFDIDKCAAQLRRFSKEEKLNTQICGICVRACGGRTDRSRRRAE